MSAFSRVLFTSILFSMSAAHAMVEEKKVDGVAGAPEQGVTLVAEAPRETDAILNRLAPETDVENGVADGEEKVAAPVPGVRGRLSIAARRLGTTKDALIASMHSAGTRALIQSGKIVEVGSAQYRRVSQSARAMAAQVGAVSPRRAAKSCCECFLRLFRKQAKPEQI